jgi:hypothetical protein
MEAVPLRKHQNWTDRHIGRNHDILHDERLIKDHQAIARGIISGGKRLSLCGGQAADIGITFGW